MSVPVLALAGFLGAGKTTLLNHLLRNSRGVRIGALVNDFGAVNIDAMFVAGQVDAMASLSNGCICCAVDASEAAEMLGRLAAVRPALDLIVVEASGIAEPPVLARTIATAGDDRFHYAGMVLVVDAAQPAELGHGVRVADLVVLNKAADGDADAVAAQVRAENPRVPLVYTDFARVDPALLIDPPVRRRERPAQLSLDELLLEDDDHHHHGHPEYQSVEFSADAPVNPRRFLAFLHDRPVGLYRAKGFVDFGDGGRYSVQLVGSSLRFEKRGAAGRGTTLVLIGTGLDVGAVSSALQDCTREPADENAMLGVHKYVV
ncbi:GTP-binding protein [Mycolicibacterium sp. P9-22]|uniref:CobW family GTP-binding protein n=1 Tax=Mycolicibacterium sp. P9-22 TaxID=2024613 RepID=UPI0011ED64F8|nr:GTP-binding protein [Mycolicibacterium sp. P9-22]KAA0118565.1 GTP-binding protein [Mycolicibacterium sp. P9-22]